MGGHEVGGLRHTSPEKLEQGQRNLGWMRSRMMRMMRRTRMMTKLQRFIRSHFTCGIRYYSQPAHRCKHNTRSRCRVKDPGTRLQPSLHLGGEEPGRCATPQGQPAAPLPAVLLAQHSMLAKAGPPRACPTRGGQPRVWGCPSPPHQRP